MILDRSAWRPAAEAVAIPTAPHRGPAGEAARAAAGARHAGSWPSFRGPQARRASPTGRTCRTRWDAQDRREHPVADADPRARALEPDRVGRSRLRDERGQQPSRTATFKPGLYGDGDASDDRSRHRWMIYALDKRTGQDRLGARRASRARRSTSATSSPPTPARRRRPTAASSSRRSDRRASTPTTSNGNLPLEGRSRPHRPRRLRHPDASSGARRARRSSGTASSIAAVRHAGRFVPARARRRDRARRVWKTERDELPSWGTPTVVDDAGGPELVTNASNFVRGYDPQTGKELWRLGGSSKITAPTPIFGDGLIVVASGRAPERPIFVVTPGARGDITLGDGDDQQRRGRVEQHRPRLLHADAARLRRACSTCWRTTACSTPTISQTGEEVYRQRLPHRRQRLQRVAGRRRRQDLPVERRRRDARRRRRAASSSSSRPTRWASC